MTEDRHERISQLAHQFWEDEGKPEGRDAEHWRMAREAIDAEENAASPPDAAIKPPKGKAGTDKAVARKPKRAAGDAARPASRARTPAVDPDDPATI